MFEEMFDFWDYFISYMYPILCDYLLGRYFEDSGCIFLVILYLSLIS